MSRERAEQAEGAERAERADPGRRQRVLVMQPSVQPPGGGNGVAAWMLHALQGRCDLSLLTLEPFQAEPVNRFYGTSIDPALVVGLQAVPRIYAWLKRLDLRLALLKNSLLIRHLQRMAGPYDLVIAANNEADLRRPGIQYVHFPTYIRPRPEVDRQPYQLRHLMKGYYAACDRLSGVTRDGIKQNLSLVNSDWTGRQMARWYDGVATTTLYPPVAGDFPDVPWHERSDDFVCIGRISREKALDRVIDILAAVRQRFPQVRLHLIGTRANTDYSRHVLRRVATEGSWITLHENIPRSELARLVAGQRFGIHGMAEEHFGMGVAEMVRAGNVVWVPAGGGQVEIVGNDERLLYRSDEDAVDKIVRALREPEHLAALRQQLAPLRLRFTETRFVDDLRAIVDEFVATR